MPGFASDLVQVIPAFPTSAAGLRAAGGLVLPAWYWKASCLLPPRPRTVARSGLFGASRLALFSLATRYRARSRPRLLLPAGFAELVLQRHGAEPRPAECPA